MKRDEDKTKEQLISELAEMHQQIAKLETSETGRKQAEEALIVQRDLSMTLSATNRLDEALKLCLETAISIAQMDSGGIYLVDSTSGSIDFACHQGFSPQFAEIASHYEPNSAQARLIMAGEAIYSRHQDLGLPLDEARRSEGVRALAIVPVLYEGRVIACLKIASHTLDDVPLTARATLETIATQIGSTIAHIEAEEALQKTEQELSQVVQGVSIATFAINKEHTLIHWNRACEKLTGIPASEVMGTKKQWQAFYPEERPVMADFIAGNQPEEEIAKWYGGKYHGSPLIEGAYEAEDFFPHLGEGGKWLSFTAAPLKDQEGKAIGAIETLQDITERKQAEEALQESETRFRSIAQSANDGIISIDSLSNIIFWNKAAQEMFGYTEEEVLGQPLTFIMPEQYRDSYRGAMERLRSTGKPHIIGETVEFTGLRKDGSEFPVEQSFSSWKARGETFYTSISRDITERKRVEEALQESEEKYRALFEESRDAVFITTRDGKLTSANQAFWDLFGYTREEAAGLDVRKVYANPDDRLKFQQEMERKGAVKDFELKLRKKDGTELDCLLTATVRQSQDGVILGYQGIIRDITGRKLAEKALRESEEKYRGLVENIDVGICRVSPGDKGDFIEVNPAMSRILGYSREELLRMNVSEMYQDPADRKKFADKVCAQGLVKNEELKLRRKDGTPIVVSNTSTAVRDKKENIIYIDATLEDITERKLAEERVVDEATRRRILVEQSRDGIVILDQNGKVYEANQQFAKMLGYSPEETAQLHVWDWDTQWTKEQLLKMLQGVDAAGDHFQTYHRRKDGTIYDVEISTNGAMYAGQKLVFCVCRDLTERKEAEETLKESEEFSSSLLSDSPNPIHVINPDTSIQYVNPALEKITGYSSAELIGRVIPYPWWPEETRDGTERDFEEALHGGMRRVEKQFQKKNGEQFWVDITFIEIKHDGKLKHYLSNWTDITERKRAEAEKLELEQQAQMASRLATVGEMASGIAHEINNPLTAVIGYADLVLERDIPQEAKEDVRIIHNGAKRVADIVKRLLTFARQYQPERTYLDINKIIKTTLELRAYELETSNIKVTTHLASDLPRTMADAGQLQQVLLNLTINAETEMNLAHEGGKLSVKTETVDDTIRISFKDDGPGISKENLEKIFNPFFTTREVGKGTGLGLSLCHGIIVEHNGRIYAESKPGKGATFIVELPVITEEKQLEMAEPAEEAKKVAPARILVVDDEPAICQFLERLLTGEGHEVETVTSAGDALEKMKGTRYRLILLDIKLPGKSGIELYKHIKDATPTWAKRIVFITGDVMGTDTRSFLSRTRVPYITKPFDTEQLKRDISRKLTEGT